MVFDSAPLGWVRGPTALGTTPALPHLPEVFLEPSRSTYLEEVSLQLVLGNALGHQNSLINYQIASRT
jgi:hypothetical protein